MDKRQLTSAISLTVAVFALWMIGVGWYEKHHPEAFRAPETPPAAAQPTQTAEAQSPTSSPASTGPVTEPSIAPEPALSAGLHAVPSTQPSPNDIELGSSVSDDPNYAVGLRLSPIGAGVESATLNSFPGPNNEYLKKADRKPYVFEQGFEDHPGYDVLATRAAVINGKAVDLDNVPWTLVSSDSTRATFSLQIADGQTPIAEITKTYRIQPRNAPDGSQGYEVAVDQSFKSLVPGQTLKVRTILNGPTPPPAEVEQGYDRMVIAGYSQPAKTIEIKQYQYTEFKESAPSKDLTKLDASHFAWIGQFSTYFGSIVLPNPDQSNDFTARAEALDPTKENRNVAITLETVEMNASAGKPAEQGLTVYFGPKWRKVLGDAHYAAWPRMFSEILTFRSGFCGFCAFPWLINILVYVLTFFHWIFRDWGLAIICLVLCVRALLHPVTKKSQIQMMKMGKLTPEVEKLKKKLADKPDELNREMMKLYKEQGGAILGCLPMFLQTPIWIALWTALQGTFELRQAPFLYGLTWIKDLAKPDQLVNITHLLGYPIPLVFGWHLSAINILPLLMAVVTYINQRYFMPMPIAATPEQQQQQKMQRGMSLIFPLMFYNLPSGLNIYYLTSTSLGIIESKIIRNHIKEHEEAEKAGKVFVTTKLTRNAKRRDGKPEEEEKPGWIATVIKWFADIQQRADEMAKEKQKRDPKKGKN